MHGEHTDGNKPILAIFFVFVKTSIVQIVHLFQLFEFHVQDNVD